MWSSPSPRRNTVSSSSPASWTPTGDDGSSVRTRSKTVSGRKWPIAEQPIDTGRILRHLPGSGWLSKFWKRKSSSSTDASPEQFDQTGGSSNRPRCHSLYKNLVGRNRTMDSTGRRRHSISGEQRSRPNSVEDELHRLLTVASRMLEKLTDQPEDVPAFGEDECIICATSRASMQTFPCGHKMLCKMCFVRTVEMALQGGKLPLRCVVCRSRIIRLKQQSVVSPVIVLEQRNPPGSYHPPHALSPLPASGVRRPGYM